MARRNAQNRRARAIVLWSALAFVGIQWVLGWAIDAWLVQVRDPEFMHRETLLQELAAQEPGQSLIVAVGSSRIMNGLDGERATSALVGDAQVFNFGIPMSGPFLERVWYERLLADGTKPDILLIEVFPAFFNAHRSRDQKELDGARLEAAEIAQVRPTLETLIGPIRRWTMGRALPTYRHQTELRWLLHIDRRRDGLDLPEDLRTVDAFGWQPRGYGPEICGTLRSLAHKQYDDCYRDFEISKEQIARLESLLARCRRDGIRAVLVLPPEGSEFRRLYSDEMKTEIDSMLARLRHDYQLPVIDARDWLDDSSFCDMHHLLPKGAREFSRRLACEYLAPLLSHNRVLALKEVEDSCR